MAKKLKAPGASRSQQAASRQPASGPRVQASKKSPEHEPARRGILYGLFSRFRKPAPASGARPEAPGPSPARPEPQGSVKKNQTGKPPAPHSLLRVYRRFTGLLPSAILATIQRRMRFAGIGPDDVPIYIGRAMLMAFVCGTLPLMLYLVIFNPVANPLTISVASGLFLGGTLLSGILYYLSFYFRIADRAAAVEKILPDFLSLAVSNLRAGMTPYAAFVHAARPEFGPFHDVVMAAMARVGSKTSIDDAFFDVASNFDSAMLRRIVTLFAKGVRSGGQLVRLLNSSADEVRRIQDLRAELISSTRTYSIFLGFTVVAVMPFLLAVSANFVSVFVGLQMDMSGIDAGSAQIPSFSGKILITPADMQTISLITLVVTSLLISALIGIVERGKAVYGVKRFPLLLLLSIAAYFLAKGVIGSFLSAFSV